MVVIQLKKAERKFSFFFWCYLSWQR